MKALSSKTTNAIEIEQKNHEIIMLQKDKTLQSVLKKEAEVRQKFILSAVFVLLLISFLLYRHHLQKKSAIFLIEQIQKQTNKLKALNNIGRDLNVHLNIEDIFNRLYKHISKVVDTHVFAIGLLDNHKEYIDFKLSIEANEESPQHVEFLDDNSRLSALCINQAREIVIGKSDELKQFIENFEAPTVGEPMESIIYLPLKNHDQQLTGCLTIQSPIPNSYNPEQVEMIKTLASYTAIAIDNALTYEQLKDKNREILATQKQLIQSSKMASIGTMTAGVAHEINNPTNFAHAAVFMMQDEIIKIKAFLKQLAGGDKAEVEVLQSFDEQFTKLIELTKTTSEGTTRIKNIVEDLRTFTRIDDVKQAQIQVSELINSTAHLVRTQYDSIVIETLLDYEPLIQCFPSKLNQVFMNIIVNACQAIESRPAFISKTEGKIVIKTEQHDNKLIISFEDNGCGMTEESLNRIFEPFYTTKDVGSGTGLGMAITFGIIDEHGGSIDVESVIDKGTKITVGFDVLSS
jgi:signal transduction histidine kinase